MEGLEDLPRVRLPAAGPGRYTLRHHPDGDHICTLEAIARALGILEGAEVQAHLQATVDLLVERVTRSRRGDTRPPNQL